jgi:trehalose 6-phosphate phosphatase
MILPGIALDQWVADASPLWFFLDYDGTLADFARNPATLERDPELVDLIRMLSAVPRFRVAIISGRPLRSLQELLPVAGIFLGGVYGIDVQTPAGDIILRGDYNRIRPFLDDAKSHWEKILADKGGFYIEDKGWSLTLHAQAAKQKDVEYVFSTVRQTAAEGLPESQFRWFDGPNYLEIVPIQAHKGELVKFLLNSYPFAGARLVYIGDDDKDQEAFEDIHIMGGINIQVSSPRHPVRYPGSDYLLSSPREVREWLKNLI